MFPVDKTFASKTLRLWIIPQNMLNFAWLNLETTKMRQFSVTIVLALLAVFAAACGNGKSADDKILTVEEFARAIVTDTTARVIDVRTSEEYARGHIEGAVLMDVLEEMEFRKSVDTLDAAHTYYIYCRSGRRSRKAAAIMQERGLKVVDLEGGYNAWQQRDSISASAPKETE